jgi:menaquinone-dependent protoporphyrinogen IX oxidase
MARVGIYYSGQGGNAARALALELRGEGHQVRLRDSAAWRSDCVEAFEQVVLLHQPANADAIRAAYQVQVSDYPQAAAAEVPTATRRKTTSR